MLTLLPPNPSTSTSLFLPHDHFKQTDSPVSNLLALTSLVTLETVLTSTPPSPPTRFRRHLTSHHPHTTSQLFNDIQPSNNHQTTIKQRGIAGAGVLSGYDKLQELLFGKVYKGGSG